MTERRMRFHFSDFDWTRYIACKTSPNFQSCNCTWMLNFSLRSGRLMVHISLHPISYGGRNILLSFVVRKKEADGVVYKKVTTRTKTFTVTDHGEEIFLGFSTYDISDLLGNLPITWTMRDLDTLISQSSQTIQHMDRLVGDLKHLLHSGDESDATFHVRGREFNVHRAILAARSEFFFAMFKHDRASRIVDIEDCEPNTFQRLLEYIYTGKVDDLNSENAIRLYKAADKYRDEELREECLECIKNGLSVESFCRNITVMLEQGQSEQMIEIAAAFFSYHEEEIIRTVEWETFSLENPDEANVLHQEALHFDKNIQTKCMFQCEEEDNYVDSCATFRLADDGSLDTKPFEVEVTGDLWKHDYTDFIDFEWKIPSILRSFYCKKILCTPVFSFLDNSWELYLNLNSIWETGGLKVDLRWKSHNIGKFLLKCTVGVKKGVLTTLQDKSAYLVMAESKIQLFSDKNDRMELFLNVREDNLVEFLSSRGGLTIIWTMEPPTNKSSQAPQPMGTDRLIRDLRNLVFNGNGSDATIRVKEREFHVHRAILSARSNVFSAMFRHDMAERESGVVDIEDCEPDTFWRFLQYVYTGEMEHLIPENDSVLYATQLYEVADKYQVEELREECLESIKYGLSAKSFCHAFALTFKHEQIEQVVGIKKFFSDNYKEIIETIEWKSFSFDYPEKANMLLRKGIDSEN